MAKTIQATLTVLISVAITALIMVAVFPAHARSDAADHPAVSDIRPAVLVEYYGTPPADASTAPTCPAFPRLDSSASCPYADDAVPQDRRVPHSAGEKNDAVASGCPYLSSLAARADCPALTTWTESSACPFLSGKDGSDASPRLSDDGGSPRTLSL